MKFEHSFFEKEMEIFSTQDMKGVFSTCLRLSSKLRKGYVGGFRSALNPKTRFHYRITLSEDKRKATILYQLEPWTPKPRQFENNVPIFICIIVGKVNEDEYIGDCVRHLSDWLEIHEEELIERRS